MASLDPRAPSTPDTVLVSYGEIGTKSREVRIRMARRLRDNVAALLDASDVDATVDREWSRLVIRATDDREPNPTDDREPNPTDDREPNPTDGPGAAADRAAAVAADAMGVVWARPGVECAADVEPIRDVLASVARDAASVDTYAVRARRIGDGDAHPFTSRDLEREGGAAVGAVTDATVDLEAPDRTYHVEVRGDDAHVAARTHEGPGGLPLGTQAPLVALLSGGHDSPVAAYEAMRRGSPIRPVYVDLGAYGGPDHVARATAAARRLARVAPNFDCRLRIVPGGDVVGELVASVEDTRMLSWRRAILRIGEVIAEGEGAVGVVTGEALGQKSSQTAANLAVTDAAVDCPVHRPLFGRDKPEILARARAIGTHAESSITVGCERLDPPHPETNATLSAVRAAEPDGLLERAADAAERHRLAEFVPDG